MALRHIAAYFYSSTLTPNQTNINEYFQCILGHLEKAQTVLEAIGYLDSIKYERFFVNLVETMKL